MHGDWAEGTGIRPTIINITVDGDGNVNHVGIGFDVVLPSGSHAQSSGHTYTNITGPERKAAQRVVDAIVADAMRAHGITARAGSHHYPSDPRPSKLPQYPASA